MSVTIPTIETERLTLRALVANDFDAFADFHASDRSVGVGGPFSRSDAWRRFATFIGHWELRGYGMWSVVEKASGLPVGHVGFWNPEGWAEPELGWIVYQDFEGKGIALEAAMAARNFAYQTMGWVTTTSVISPDNLRSIALAERMGATFERKWETPSGHQALIYRHPAPEAQA